MQSEAAWENLTNLPVHDGKGWAIIKKHSISSTDMEGVSASIQRWLPPNPLLIGAPGARQFLPPISIQQFKNEVLLNIAKNSKRLTSAFVATGLIVAIGGLFNGTRSILPVSLVFVLFGMLFYLDYRIGLRTETGVFERAMFFRWLRTSSQGRAGFYIWLSISALIGANQLVLQSKLGGIDELFAKYGAMYPAIRAGELWRLLTGPYFHYSVAHYLLNALLLLFIGTLTWAMKGPASILVFVVGNGTGACMQMLFGGDAFNNFGGISPGIYTLFGFFLAASALGHIKLPKGFTFLCGGLALLGVVGSSLISNNAATVAHVSGLFLGALLALLARSLFLRRSDEQR